ncbi:MAG: glycoside hydrolase family 127 protein [Eubacteriales bacterium]|nr:glycoside hydrolase family 127 protein [Eubacteriales bacterium]
MDKKYQVPYRTQAPMGGVRLTGGRFARAFENNVDFLKGFDLDRMLYWYRVHAGKPAQGVPYAAGDGHFENNLKGQTAGEFLMGACTSLLWKEDEALRKTVRAILDEISGDSEPDGFLLPITQEEYRTREYPNYTRAWVTFGLLDAGYAGEERGFTLARAMSDSFNHSEVLPYVKDMNLGFQGILASTRMYDAPNGKNMDVEVARQYYQEDWWLKQIASGDQRAIYDHPGNHPHSTLLTTLEGYLDLYRITGEPLYWNAVTSALSMYEKEWQHVGGGIAMCENDTFYPGCLWLSPEHHYNELCSTNFWVLLNQRMQRLEPDNAHYADEMENSLYNVLLAAQVGNQGYHYLNFLERIKDWRYLDRATCCASLGTRLCGLLPQFLYTYSETEVYVNLYAQSTASLPNGVTLCCDTCMPDDGHVKIRIIKADQPICLHLRIPRWAVKDGKSYYEVHQNVKTGDCFTLDFPMSYRVTHYRGGERKPDEDRCALEYGPLLYAAMGAPNPVQVHWNAHEPEKWFIPIAGEKRRLKLAGDTTHEYWAYCEIGDEPFSVYPVVKE